MANEETRRVIPGAKNTVLFLHGIAGTPDHFRKLISLEGLVPDGWSCYNVLIEGHGKQVEDFFHSSMKAWKDYVFSVFDDLCRTHDRVIIVGHSMGTLFAMQMALQRPEKVASLILLAVPLRVGIKLFGVCNLARYAFGKLDSNDPVQAATGMACSISPTRKVWKYIGWIPRMIELLQEMHRTAKVIPALSVPAVAFQSKRDELVSGRSRKILEASGRVEVHTLHCSTHFYYHPDDVKIVQDAFRGLCLDVEKQ